MITALDMIVSDIRKALNCGASYAALATTLTIPDVCAALEATNGQSTGKLYQRWYDQYIGPRYNGMLSAKACYSLRCGVVHQGQVSVAGVPKIAKAIFRLPQQTTSSIHANTVNDMVQFDLRTFCEDFINAIDQWWKAKGSDPTVKANVANLLRYYPNMVMVGIPLGPTIA